MAASSRTSNRGRRPPNKARNSDRESAVSPTPRAASPPTGNYVVNLPKSNIQREPVCIEEAQKTERVVEEIPVVRTLASPSPKSKPAPLEAQNEKPAAPVKPQGSEEVAGSTPSSSKPTRPPFLAFGRPAHPTRAKVDEDCPQYKTSKCPLRRRCPRVHPIMVQDSKPTSQPPASKDATPPKEEQPVQEDAPSASQPEVPEVRPAPEPESQPPPEAQPKPEPQTDSPKEPIKEPFLAFGRPAHRTLALRNEDCRNFKTKGCRSGISCFRVHPMTVQEFVSSFPSGVVEDLTKQPKEEKVVQKDKSSASQPEVLEVKAALEPEPEPKPEARPQAEGETKSEAGLESTPFLAFGRPAYKTLALRDEDCPRFKMAPSLCGYGSSCSRVHPRTVQASTSISQTGVTEDLAQQPKEQVVQEDTSNALQPEAPEEKLPPEPEAATEQKGQPELDVGLKSEDPDLFSDSQQPTTSSTRRPFMPFGRPALRTAARINQDCRDFQQGRCKWGRQCRWVHPILPKTSESISQPAAVENGTIQLKEDQPVQEATSTASQPEAPEAKVLPEAEARPAPGTQHEPKPPETELDPEPPNNSIPPPFMAFGRPAYPTLAKLNLDCRWFMAGDCFKGESCDRVHPKRMEPSASTPVVVEDQVKEVKEEGPVTEDTPTASQPKVPEPEAAPEPGIVAEPATASEPTTAPELVAQPESGAQPQLKDSDPQSDSCQSIPSSSNPIPPPFLAFGRPAHRTQATYNDDCRQFMRGWCRFGRYCHRVHPLLVNIPGSRFRTRVEDNQPQLKNVQEKEEKKEEDEEPRTGEDTPTTSQKVPEVESEAESEDPDLLDDSFLFGSAPTSPAPPLKDFECMSQISSEHPSEGTLTESPKSSLSGFDTYTGTSYTGTSSSATSPPPSVIGSSTVTSLQSKRTASLTITRPYCRNWMLNRCTLDRRCYFYHGGIRYNPPVRGVHPRPRFASICPIWEGNRCMRNWLCDFVHPDLKYDDIDWIDPWHGRPQAASLPPKSLGELMHLDPSEREQYPPRPPYAPIICRRWLNKECSHLWSCKYVHEDVTYDPPVPVGKFPFPTSDDICPDIKCSKGHGCDFIHEDLDYSDCMSESDLPPAQSNAGVIMYNDPPPGQRPRPPCEKACPLHAQGHCSRRYRCRYLHLELDYDPPVLDDRPRPKPRPPPFSPAVCRKWLIGQCSHGMDCKYVHDDIEYDPPVLNSKYSLPPSKALCTDTLCTKGFACRYTHPELDYSNCLSEDSRIPRAKDEPEEPEPLPTRYHDPPPGQRPKPPSQNPCLLHSLGQCNLRYRCKYVHEELEYDSPVVAEDPPVGRRPLPAIAETCVKWLRDECPLRYECKFRHGDLDYDPLFPPGLAPPPGLEKNAPTQKSARPPLYLRVRDHAKVKIAAGFKVLEITTGFETPWVFINNIPKDVGAEEVAKLVRKYGEPLDIKFTSQHRVSMTKVRFSTSAEALEACTQLNGIQAFETTITARLPVSSATKSSATFQDTSVRIRWEAPSKTAYCGFSTREQAEKAIASTKTPYGDNCVAGNIHVGIPVVGIVTVRFRGVPVEAKDGDMERFNHPEDIVWAQPNYKDFPGSVNGIRRILTGDIQPLDFNVLPPPYRYGGIAQAWAHFSTPAEADAACKKLHGWKPLFTGKTRITAQHVKSLTFSLSPLVYDSIQNDIRALKRTVDRSRRTAMTVFPPRAPQSPFTIKLAGDDLKELGQLKAEFESILNWETLKSGGRDAYDAYFAHGSGKAFLDALSRRNSDVRIQNDVPRRSIRLRGSSYARRRVKEQILSKIAELKSRKIRTIPLDGTLFGVFLCKFRDDLYEEVGQDNIMMDMSNHALCVRGDNNIFSIALEFVRKAKLSLKGSENRRYVTQCPVCLDEVTQPVLLPCGHSWCQGCLVRYLLAALDTKSFPLICLGQEGNCGEPIALTTARTHLSQNDFEALVDAAFENYVHCHQDEFKYCPTPDCSQIYRPGAPETVLQCPSCLLRICPNCHIEAHDGFDCPEKDGGHTMFKEWMKNHDVKPCPGCNAPIERSEGCNHMTCTMCKTHICWVCMETFPGGKGIYDHMRSAHGGIGLPDPLQEYMQQGY